MAVSEVVFWFVPLLALLFNLFIFLTFLAAKKSRIVYSFILLLTAFTVWTAGSFFMRLSLYPGEIFWFEFSLTGILAVPFCYYQFMHDYTGQKGRFIKSILLIISLAMIVLNLFNVFITPTLESNVPGSESFTYQMHWPLIFVIIFVFYVVLLSFRMAYQSVKRNSVSGRMFKPLILGIVVMFIGIMVQVIPGFGTSPATRWPACSTPAASTMRCISGASSR